MWQLQQRGQALSELASAQVARFAAQFVQHRVGMHQDGKLKQPGLDRLQPDQFGDALDIGRQHRRHAARITLGLAVKLAQGLADLMGVRLLAKLFGDKVAQPDLTGHIVVCKAVSGDEMLLAFEFDQQAQDPV